MSVKVGTLLTGATAGYLMLRGLFIVLLRFWNLIPCAWIYDKEIEKGIDESRQDQEEYEDPDIIKGTALPLGCSAHGTERKTLEPQVKNGAMKEVRDPEPEGKPEKALAPYQADEDAIKRGRILYRDVCDCTSAEFERYCGWLFEGLGYHARVTREVKDGGVDIELVKGGIPFIVQCKQYLKETRVQVDEVRSFYGAMIDYKPSPAITAWMAAGRRRTGSASGGEQSSPGHQLAMGVANGGFFVTTAFFTEPALKFAEGKRSLHLWDHDELCNLLLKYEKVIRKKEEAYRREEEARAAAQRELGAGLVGNEVAIRRLHRGEKALLEQQEGVPAGTRPGASQTAPTRAPAVPGQAAAAAVSQRRPYVPWSEEETAALEEGVNKFGVGRWKDLWQEYRHKFLKCRTPQDLKDKWQRFYKPRAPRQPLVEKNLN